MGIASKASPVTPTERVLDLLKELYSKCLISSIENAILCRLLRYEDPANMRASADMVKDPAIVNATNTVLACYQAYLVDNDQDDLVETLQRLVAIALHHFSVAMGPEDMEAAGIGRVEFSLAETGDNVPSFVPAMPNPYAEPVSYVAVAVANIDRVSAPRVVHIQDNPGAYANEVVFSTNNETPAVLKRPLTPAHGDNLPYISVGRHVEERARVNQYSESPMLKKALSGGYYANHSYYTAQPEPVSYTVLPPLTPARPYTPAKPMTPAEALTPARPFTPARAPSPAMPLTPAVPYTPAQPYTPAAPMEPASPLPAAMPWTPAQPLPRAVITPDIDITKVPFERWVIALSPYIGYNADYKPAANLAASIRLASSVAVRPENKLPARAALSAITNSPRIASPSKFVPSPGKENSPLPYSRFPAKTVYGRALGVPGKENSHQLHTPVRRHFGSPVNVPRMVMSPA